MPETGGSPEVSSISSEIATMLGPMLTLYRQNIDKMVQPYGISAGQSALFMLLSQQDGQNQMQLSRKLGIKPSSLTTMLNRLEKNGLLERRRNSSDHRAYNVFLTPKGWRASKKLSAIVNFVNERSVAGFRQEEKLLLLRLLEQMAANMEKQRSELSQVRQDELLLKEYRDAQKAREGGV